MLEKKLIFIFHNDSVIGNTVFNEFSGPTPPARTIADLEAAPTVQQHHINEAIAYRNLDRTGYLTPGQMN